MSSATLLDAAISNYGGKNWTLATLDSPACGMKQAASMDDAISLTTFLREACRPLDGIEAGDSPF